jgi:hypothetical protein
VVYGVDPVGSGQGPVVGDEPAGCGATELVSFCKFNSVYFLHSSRKSVKIHARPICFMTRGKAALT